MTNEERKAALEAIIYAADEPATIEQLSAALGEEKLAVQAALDELVAGYAVEERGVEIRAVAGGYKMYTKPQHHDVVRRFIKSLRPPLRLSMPALETLAVIAYKQPVTAPEISEIRGVNSSGVISTLLDRRLITTAGRKEVIGRPILYKSSKEFLMRFGLSDLDELPSLKEFEALAREALGNDAGVTIGTQTEEGMMNKPAEVMSTLADPEGRKTLKNLLRGFPSRVYPVGNLEYAATGLVFLTNDGDLAAELLKKWEHLEQIYYIKIKGMLTVTDLERVGKEAGVKMQTLRQPGAARGHGANYWYEVTMRDSKLESLRRVLFREKHPMEKLKRVALGPLTIEGISPGRYRPLQAKEAQTILAMKPVAKKFVSRQEPTEQKRPKRRFQKRGR